MNKKEKKLQVEKRVTSVSNDRQSDQPKSLNKEDSIILLAIKINIVNARNYNQFLYVMQFDIEEPKTDAQVMQRPNKIQ